MGLIQPVPGLPVGRPIRDGWLVQPKNTLPAINEMWAFVSVDPRDGNDALYSSVMLLCEESRSSLLVEEGQEIPDTVRAVAKGIEFFKPGDDASMKAATERLCETVAAHGIQIGKRSRNDADDGTCGT